MAAKKPPQNGNGSGKPEKNGHKPAPPPSQKLTPKAHETEKKKAAFIVALKKHHGIISKALAASKLGRTPAYEHFKSDSAFAEAWLEAIDASNDLLLVEAMKRAKVGSEKKTTYPDGSVVVTRDTSDTLLIFLIKRADNLQRHRQRFVQFANKSLEVITTSGREHGLTNEQITAIQDSFLEFTKTVSLA